MKRIVLLTVALSLSAIISLHAQEGEIIYTEFDPPLEIVQNIYGPSQVLELDFDGDGAPDHRIYGKSSDDLKSHEWNLLEVSLNGWETRLVNLDEHNPYTFDESDTIIPNAPNGWNHGPDFVHFYYPDLSANGIYHETYGMHKVIDGKNYYGWYHGYGSEGRLYSEGPYEYRVYIDKIAFCTMPEYPLRWGQISLTDGIGENETTAFATIYPNPANSIVTVTGKNLKSAEVINTLGQRVATVKGQGETLQIDIANLPTGVYFVRITDEEGRKCVRKVVKE